MITWPSFDWLWGIDQNESPVFKTFAPKIKLNTKYWVCSCWYCCGAATTPSSESSAVSMSYFTETGSVSRTPARCFPGRIPALQPGTVSAEEMREIEPSLRFLKSGLPGLRKWSGGTPRCSKVTTPLHSPHGLFGLFGLFCLFGLSANSDWHQSVTALRENTLEWARMERDSSSRSSFCLFFFSMQFVLNYASMVATDNWRNAAPAATPSLALSCGQSHQFPILVIVVFSEMSGSVCKWLNTEIKALKSESL